MKKLLLALAILCFGVGQMVGQKVYYYLHVDLKASHMQMGRTKMISNVLVADKSTSTVDIKKSFVKYLAENKPSATEKKYVKSTIPNWLSICEDAIYVIGPLSYSEASKRLRKNITSLKSRDWFVIQVSDYYIE